MQIKVQVHTSDAQGNVYTLLEPLTCRDLTVPAGFKSDGASVPRIFWRIVFPPGDSRALRAAMIHDYIYREHPTGWTREAADELFHNLLIEDGVSAFSASLAYWGVRLFGRASWEAGTQKSPA